MKSYTKSKCVFTSEKQAFKEEFNQENVLALFDTLKIKPSRREGLMFFCNKSN